MRKRFIALRYFMVPVDFNLFFEPLTKEEKKQLFINAFLVNQEFTTKRGVKLCIRGIEKKDDLFYGKLGKYTTVKLDQDILVDFEPLESDGYFTIRFVCDTEKQILVLEMNSNFESDILKIISWLESLTNIRTLIDNYTVSFRAIVPRGDFWQILNEATSVYYVNLVLESPNLFGGKTNAEQGLRELQSIFNQNTFSFKFENKKGKLKVPKNQFTTYIDYADQGGGHWIVSIIDKLSKKRKRINSAHRIASTTINIDNKTEEEVLKNALEILEDFDEYTKGKDKD